jgi:hypothetical protein
MHKKLRIGDHVSWNSEAGRVRGRIVKVHTRYVIGFSFEICNDFTVCQ